MDKGRGVTLWHCPTNIKNHSRQNSDLKNLWPFFMYGVRLPQGYIQGHYVETVYFLPFLPLSPMKFLVVIWSTLDGWKAESTLGLPIGFKHGTPGLGIQCLNHYVTKYSCLESLANFIEIKLNLKNYQRKTRSIHLSICLEKNCFHEALSCHLIRICETVFAEARFFLEFSAPQTNFTIADKLHETPITVKILF